MNADVAVIIVTYNSERHIGACLDSVLSECHKVRHQIIVLDNNSSDNTVRVVREGYPMVELLTPGSNLGFAAGVNQAARSARSEFVLLLNPDTVIVDHAIDKIVEFARAHPRYGLYGGRTLKQDGSLEPSSCWGLPTLWSLALFAVGATTLAPRNRWLDPESLGKWQRDSVREVGVITGCFLLIRKSTWEELGGFDERYFMYGEDVDLAMRARDGGYRPVICPEARLVHEVGQSSATPVAKMLLLYRGKACLVRTHWKGPRQCFGLFLLAAGVGVRAFLGAASVFARGGSTNKWQSLWTERRRWLQGYPTSTETTPNKLTPTAV